MNATQRISRHVAKLEAEIARLREINAEHERLMAEHCQVIARANLENDRLRSRNSELLAACEGLIDLISVDCDLTGAEDKNILAGLAAIAKARQTNAFDPGRDDSQTHDIPV